MTYPEEINALPEELGDNPAETLASANHALRHDAAVAALEAIAAVLGLDLADVLGDYGESTVADVIDALNDKFLAKAGGTMTGNQTFNTEKRAIFKSLNNDWRIYGTGADDFLIIDDAQAKNRVVFYGPNQTSNPNRIQVWINGTVVATFTPEGITVNANKQLTLPTNPTDASHATRKAYVDALDAARQGDIAVVQGNLDFVAQEVARLALQQFIDAVNEVGGAEGLENYVYEAFLTGDDRGQGSGQFSDLVRGVGLGDGYASMPKPYEDSSIAGDLRSRYQVSGSDGWVPHQLPSECERVLLLAEHDFDHQPVTTDPTFTRASTAINPQTGAEVESGEARHVRGRNLLTAEEASPSGGWNSNNATRTYEGPGEAEWGNSVLVTSTGSAHNGIWLARRIPITAGETIACRARVEGVTNPAQLRWQVTWYDAEGVPISSSYMGGITPTIGQWGDANGTAEAPEGTVEAGVQLYTSGTHTPGSWRFAKIMVAKAASVPEFVPGGDRAVLIEEGTENLSGAGTAKNGSATRATRIDDQNDPFGGTDAVRLVEDEVNGSHYWGFGFINDATTEQRALSVYVKPAGRTAIKMHSQAGDPGGVSTAFYDLATGTATVSGANIADAYMVPHGEGWWRCVIVPVEGSEVSALVVGLRNDQGSTSYVGDGESGIYISHPQIEAKPYATSWSPVGQTRDRESLTVPSSAIPTSRFTVEADVYISEDAVAAALGGSNVFLLDGGGTGVRRLSLFLNATTAKLSGYMAATTGESTAGLDITAGWHRVALVYDGNEFFVALDGVASSKKQVGAMTGAWSNATVHIGGSGGDRIHHARVAGLRVSGRVRTATELADWTAPLTMDGDTTYLLDTSTLDAVERDTTLTWQATLDGGAHWQTIEEGTPQVLDHPGDQFAIRAEVTRPDGSISQGRIYWAVAYAGKE